MLVLYPYYNSLPFWPIHIVLHILIGTKEWICWRVRDHCKLIRVRDHGKLIRARDHCKLIRARDQGKLIRAKDHGKLIIVFYFYRVVDHGSAVQVAKMWKSRKSETSHLLRLVKLNIRLNEPKILQTFCKFKSVLFNAKLDRRKTSRKGSFEWMIGQFLTNKKVLSFLPKDDARKVCLERSVTGGGGSQCDQIWRNFVTLAKLQKPVAIFWVFIKYLGKILDLLWQKLLCF